MIASSPILTLQDINQVIKYFAFHIQLRIEELDQKRGLFLSFQDISSAQEQQSASVANIIQKYSSSQTSNPLEHKLIKKFTQRILQIFQFFRQKTSRHSQSLLNLIESKIKLRLEALTENEHIEIAQVLRFAFSLTRKGFIGNILKGTYSNGTKKEKLSKANKRYLRSCVTSIKINAMESPLEQEEDIHQAQRSHQNHTVMTKLSVAKSHLTFQPFQTKQTLKEKSERKNLTNFQRPVSSKPARSLQRSENSSQNIHSKPQRKYSLSKKRDTYLKVIFKNEAHQKQSKTNLAQTSIEIDKLYVGMDIDKRYIQKTIDKRDFMVRDSMKRNERIFNRLKREGKRERTFPVEQFGEKEEDPSVNDKSQTLEIEVKPLTENTNRNLITNTFQYFGKKQSVRTMAYQNYLQKKKKVFDTTNGNRKSINNRNSVNDKENIQCFI